MNGWMHLLVAGLFEVVFTLMLKLSQGGEKLNYALASGLTGFLSFYFLNKALVQMPLSLAYPVWTGMGTVGSILVGMLFFHEPFSLIKMLLLLILCTCVIILSTMK